MKLFTEIGLVPSKASGDDEKSKRKNILQAMELEEKESDKKTEKSEKPTPAVSQDEKEEGEELEQDQLDALYSEFLSHTLIILVDNIQKRHSVSILTLLKPNLPTPLDYH